MQTGGWDMLTRIASDSSPSGAVREAFRADPDTCEVWSLNS
jgi:hypothetical protein